MSNMQKEKDMYKLIDTIIQKEKPNIIHTHFLIFSCLPAYYAASKYNLPLFSSAWSKRAITNDRVLKIRLSNLLKKTSYLVMNSLLLYNEMESMYGLNGIKWLPINPPIDLSPYHEEQVKDLSVPKILSARAMREAYHQDLLIKSIPKILEKNNKTQITIIIGQSARHGKRYFNEMVDLSKRVGVYNKCTFIDRGLSQQDFTNLIKAHNIVYAVAEDMGTSGTVIQAAYSGAITIIQNSFVDLSLLRPSENVLHTFVRPRDVEKVLCHSVMNLKTIQPVLYKNNRKLKSQSAEYTCSILTNAYDEVYRATHS
jgi:glycosyltransferase involved in cell wall biosynthesis